MRRWNGWGDEAKIYPIHRSTINILQSQLGEGDRSPDATLEQALATVPNTRLHENPLILTNAEDRLFHARGQSLPDWIALRSGRVLTFPDGVAYPTCDDEVHSLLEYAVDEGASLIPYGGGTSVVGHINPLPESKPILTVDLSRMSKLLNIDRTSRLAEFEAGVNGPMLEDQLRPLGYTLGHFPQSFEYSTLGGWIATRSCGQQSYYYGRIEDLFAGGQIETPHDTIELHPLPASAAGPDLREMILGSEGRLGVITRAVMRVHPLPEFEEFYGVFFHDWASGIEAIRHLAQDRVRVSMARLSDARETETTLLLSGKDKLVSWVDRGLKFLQYKDERCLLIFGITGEQRKAEQALRQARDIFHQFGGLFTGKMIGKIWRKSRFFTPYLRNSLWECGYAVDTLETALPWSKVVATAEAIKDAITESMSQFSITPMVLIHISHIYSDGASIYVTYLFPRARDPDEILHHWQLMKGAASNVILSNCGTISHQHGVGLDHAPYLATEISSAGQKMIKDLAQTIDPSGLLNPGKLWVD